MGGRKSNRAKAKPSIEFKHQQQKMKKNYTTANVHILTVCGNQMDDQTKRKKMKLK